MKFSKICKFSASGLSASCDLPGAELARDDHLPVVAERARTWRPVQAGRLVFCGGNAFLKFEIARRSN